MNAACRVSGCLFVCFVLVAGCKHESEDSATKDSLESLTETDTSARKVPKEPGNSLPQKDLAPPSIKYFEQLNLTTEESSALVRGLTEAELKLKLGEPDNIERNRDDVTRFIWTYQVSSEMAAYLVYLKEGVVQGVYYAAGY